MDKESIHGSTENAIAVNGRKGRCRELVNFIGQSIFSIVGSIKMISVMEKGQ
jgi:hypothetical protein